MTEKIGVMLLIGPAVAAAWRWGGRNECDHLAFFLPVIVAAFLSVTGGRRSVDRLVAPGWLVVCMSALTSIGVLLLVQSSCPFSIQPTELSVSSSSPYELTARDESRIPLTPASIDLNETRIQFVQFVAVMLTLLAGFRLCGRREARALVFAVLLANGAFVASAVIFDAPVWSAAKREFETSVPRDVVGLFANRGHAALYLNLAFAAGLGLLSQCAQGKSADVVRWMTYLGMIVVLAGIACSGSISGVLIVLLGSGVIGLSQHHHRGRVVGFGVAALVVLATGFTVVEAVPAAFRRAMSVTPVWGSVSVRWNHWTDMIHLIDDVPLFGTGAGTYGLISPPFQRHASFGYFANADNLVFEQVIETGLVGGSLWLSAAGGLFGCLIVRIAAHRSSAMVGPGMAGLWALTAMFANSLVDFGLLLPANAIQGALLVGCVLSCPSDPSSADQARPRSRFLPPARVRLLRMSAVIALLPWGPVAALEMSMYRRADLALQRWEALPMPPDRDDLAECDGRLRDALRVRATDPRLIVALAELTVLQARMTMRDTLRSSSSFAAVDDQALWAITSPQILADVLLYARSDRLSQQINAAVRAASTQKPLEVATELLGRAQKRSPYLANVDLQLAHLDILCQKPESQVVRSLRRSLWLQPTEFPVLEQSLRLGAALHNQDVVASCANHVLTYFASDVEKRRFTTSAAVTEFPDDCEWQIRTFREFPEAMLSLLDNPHSDCTQRIADVAFDDLRLALLYDVDDADSHLLMARLQQFRGDPESQIEHLRAAVNLRPTVPTLRLEMARALWSRGRIADAREQLISAEALCRHRPDLRGSIGQLRKRMNENGP